MKIVSAAFIIGLCLWRVAPARAEPFSLPESQEKYISRLIARANSMNLSETKEWLALMHFQNRLFINESTLDSATFFLSKKGKTTPTDELNATLRAFFMPVKAVEKKEGVSDTYNHPLCLFPARFMWLDNQLKIDRSQLPLVNCKEYEEFKEKLNASRSSLIYTSAYIGNPASFFGHTLLRLDSKEDLPLLSHAVNYGAITGADGGIPFMIKGVFGGYPGVFSVSPYYDTVNMYNNMENRDIWEYRLNMDQNKVDFLTAHIWEAGNNYADYFFFSENCSYMLMEMLDVIYPDASLAQGFYRPYFSSYVIPTDTIRALSARKNILGEAVYRPSRRTRIKHAYTHLSEKEKVQLRKVLHSPRRPEEVSSSSLSPTEKANVLETAYDYLQYEFLAEHIGLEEMRSDTIRLLTERNKIPEKSNFPAIPVPETRPEQGHKSAAMAVYFGQRNDKTFIEYTLRPAYHTLLDDSSGYIPFEEITYLETTLRWYENENELRLQRMNLLGIRSIAARDELFKPLSFHFETGFESYAYPSKEKEGYAFYLNGGIGLSYELLPNVRGFSFINFHGKAGGYLPNNGLAGIGAQIGMAANFGRIRLTADAERITYSSKMADTAHYGAEISLNLSRNVSIGARYLFEDNRKNDIHEWRTGLQIHF